VTCSETSYVLPGAVRHTLGLGEGDRWEVSVALPPPALYEAAGEGPYPTLYLLDGYFTFAVAAQVAQTTLDFSDGNMRPVVIVGIAPAIEDRERLRALRIRDLTPTSASPVQIAGQDIYGAGKAEAMLRLILTEIVPRLESMYPLDPADRGIGGWSLGGLFACWALTQEGNAFKRFLAVSPSLWWDEGYLLDEYRVSYGRLSSADIYLAIGEHESDLLSSWPPVPAAQASGLGELDMVADMTAFATRLQREPDLRVTAEVIPDEHHSTIWGAAVTRGLVDLYRTDR
jgi:predicted alpha/beta superfamily hydrolase